ncbi:cbb3-type cytochrome c oxidase subunit 3 [Aliigemmobacter aestuarii]|uniref:Cbb3-type cytochrome c oxidase subunit 3 n=1 Tax=Aliigemmobacter aestuarii TaxID=1445661 RepID=A0A4S3MM70_9RHOB|nr:cbb3-type cytochrome c oxidase subunit 3 [Gemmobacter aestuarii]THD83478.1 cbb3-type cytochrome c oxidase subunit 3 [Gemmobacter aestuarii]
METYSFLRQFADSWMLLFMMILFLGVVGFAFRPGSRKVQSEAANSIFRNERKPAAEATTGPNSKEA